MMVPAPSMSALSENGLKELPMMMDILNGLTRARIPLHPSQQSLLKIMAGTAVTNMKPSPMMELLHANAKTLVNLLRAMINQTATDAFGDNTLVMMAIKILIPQL